MLRHETTNRDPHANVSVRARSLLTTGFPFPPLPRRGTLSLLAPVLAVATFLAFAAAPARADLRRQPAVDFSSFPPGSLRCCLVIDCSGSMQGAKIARAREEAILSLESMPETWDLSVCAFDSSVRFAWQGWEQNGAARRDVARAWIEALEAGGTTRTAEALEAAFRLESRVADDTFYLLITDGAPDGSWEDQARRVRDANLETRPILVLGIGGDCRDAFCETVARESGGEFVRAD